jgi:two-component system nitrate/nitrite response regulator NarL
MEHAGESVRVLIADDHHIFLEGLRRAFEEGGMEVVAETYDGHGVVSLACELHPDVAVLDLRMGDVSGLEVLSGLRRSCPDVQVVILTVSNAATDVIAALAGGACGYLLKDSRADQLAASVRQAAEGQMVLSPRIARALAEHVRAHAEQGDSGGNAADGRGASRDHGQATEDVATLTPREMEVLGLIVEGADNATIGRTLSISPHTVKQYVANIFQKLGVRSRVQAAVYAIRSGLV